MADEPLYALTQRTADRVRQLVADGGSAGPGPAPTGAAARGVTWVKVTGSPDGSGWHPAVVTLDLNGTWSDLTNVVHVKADDGTRLTSGNRYLCTRTGDDTDGTARFRVRQPRQVTKGKLDGALAAGGSATLSVWEWNGSAEADTSEDLTVYDWLMVSGQTIASGAAVTAEMVGGRWYVTGASCS